MKKLIDQSYQYPEVILYGKGLLLHRYQVFFLLAFLHSATVLCFNLHCIFSDAKDANRSFFLQKKKILGTGVFDAGALKGFKITIDKEGLIEMFQSTTSSTMRLAIMHYATVHCRDLAMIKRVSIKFSLFEICFLLHVSFFVLD